MKRRYYVDTIDNGEDFARDNSRPRQRAWLVMDRETGQEVDEFDRRDDARAVAAKMNAAIVGAVLALVVSCGGTVREMKDATDEPASDAVFVDVSDAAAPDVADVADGSACPQLGASCTMGSFFCADDEQHAWICPFGMWEMQPCAPQPPFCASDGDGGFRCSSPKCKP